ncbi:MAG: peptidase M14, partial [Burkholderiaceae bacterium]|nr:peptidase M14 [Burkholderiaceae bacterium]
FEGLPARRAAERQLAAAGVRAHLHSAYKPLVFYFLEEVDASLLAEVTVHYPVHPKASPQRFLQEAYPLAALLEHCKLTFLPGTDDLHYRVDSTHRDGTRNTARVWAPNRTHTDLQGIELLSPTGWVHATPAGATEPTLDTARATDYEQLFTTALSTLDSHPWSAQAPYFERLELRIDLPCIEQRLPVGHETIRSLEGLHEDLYFSLIEIFQRHAGLPAGDRSLQPGQIVPDLRASVQTPRLRITLQAFDVAAQDLCAAALPATTEPLEWLGTAPSPERIATEMLHIDGERFGATSRQGRAVTGLYRRGSDMPVFISGGQHANETSGIVGALRAAGALNQQADAHFALMALENPDGYALHRELRVHNPSHMHHAARYSALGDDIEYRQGLPLYERAARQQALALSGAQLHLNLHGYPAHEWTRPLSGYIPRGFELWTIPKGFFLILRYHPGWQMEAMALLHAVCTALSQLPGLAAFNARQMALYERHAGKLQFDTLHGTAYTATESANPDSAPVTLITEYPDETIEGDDFRQAHTVQMHTVLAATAAWQKLARTD